MSTTLEVQAVSPATVRNGTRRTFGNLAHVVGGEAMLRVANFAAAIVIARVGGAATFGIYATALAYATVAAMIADNGLQIGAVREVSAKPGLANQTLSRLYVAKTLLFIPMVVVLALLWGLAHLSKLEWAIASIITLRTVLQSYCQMQIAVIKAIDRMHAIGVIQGLHSAVLLAGLWGCYVTRSKILVVVILLLSGQILELALEVAWLCRSGIRVVAVRLRECWSMLHGSTTMGITVSLSAAMIRLDVIVLALIASAAIAGMFAAAQTVIVIVYVLGWLLASVLFPEMSRLAGRAGDLDAYMRHWTLITAFVLVPSTLVAMAVGPPLMRMLFGPKLLESGRLLTVMLPAAPFIVLNSLSMHRAFALHTKRIYLGIYCGATVLAVIVNSIMALSFGAVGVAIAVVLREVAIFVAFRVMHERAYAIANTADALP